MFQEPHSARAGSGVLRRSANIRGCPLREQNASGEARYPLHRPSNQDLRAAADAKKPKEGDECSVEQPNSTSLIDLRIMDDSTAEYSSVIS
jgi:hypothetical protein